MAPAAIFEIIFVIFFNIFLWTNPSFDVIIILSDLAKRLFGLCHLSFLWDHIQILL